MVDRVCVVFYLSRFPRHLRVREERCLIWKLVFLYLCCFNFLRPIPVDDVYVVLGGKLMLSFLCLVKDSTVALENLYVFCGL